MSMRSVDETQSRVVRYSGTSETMIIQNYSKGKPLFSVGDINMVNDALNDIVHIIDRDENFLPYVVYP